jgi:hypothetical protein
MKAYDPAKDHSYIAYLDANNLYGWAMSQNLPVGNFKFLSEDVISRVDFINIDDESPTGYVIECDLDYPDNLHDAHNDYQLAPESMLITKSMLSPFCETFNVKHVDCRKLVPNLSDKQKYVTHYRNLKLYLSLGLIVKKIHRVASFDQKPWMKSYIESNTLSRQLATDEFTRDLYKYLNNSIFGKSMEDIRGRKHVCLKVM